MQKLAKIYVLDLDNTLYDTWPSLINRPNKSHRVVFLLHELKRLLTLRAFASIRSLFRTRLNRHGCDVLFLSARNKVTFIVTGLRLSFDMRKIVFGNLKLVPQAKDKIEVLSNLATRYEKVVFVDDLSFGHEAHAVRRYHDVILASQRLKVTLVSGERLERLKH